MEILAARIKRQLLLDTGKWGHCAIYENELQRIWPLNEENRKRKIEQFAKKYGLRLSFYKSRLCAIFEKERPRLQVWRGRRRCVNDSFVARPLRNTAKNFEATVARLEATDRQSESKSKLSLLRSKK